MLNKEKTEQIDNYYLHLTPFQKKLARKFPTDDDGGNSLMDEFSRVIVQEKINDVQIKKSILQKDFFLQQKLIEKSVHLKKKYSTKINIHKFLIKNLRKILGNNGDLTLLVDIQKIITACTNNQDQKNTNKTILVENIRLNKFSIINTLKYYYLNVANDSRDKIFFDDLLNFLFSDKTIYKEVREDFRDPNSFLSNLLSESEHKETLELIKQKIEKSFCEECLVVSIPLKFSLFDGNKSHINQEKNEHQFMSFQQKI